MKKKEIKKLAERIAKLETIIEESDNRAEVLKAQDEIMSISGSISPFDMMIIDEMVQEILNKNSWHKKIFLI